jgi:hypothetical protein
VLHPARCGNALACSCQCCTLKTASLRVRSQSARGCITHPIYAFLPAVERTHSLQEKIVVQDTMRVAPAAPVGGLPACATPHVSGKNTLLPKEPSMSSLRWSGNVGCFSLINLSSSKQHPYLARGSLVLRMKLTWPNRECLVLEKDLSRLIAM